MDCLDSVRLLYVSFSIPFLVESFPVLLLTRSSRAQTPAGTDSPRAGEGQGSLDNLQQKLSELSTASKTAALASPFDDDDDDDEIDDPYDFSDYTEEEIGCADKSVKILPGVARLIGSLPAGRFAVATSGAKTYCHGALLRAGIRPFPFLDPVELS